MTSGMRSHMARGLDPVTVELIRNNFLSVCEEMAESLVRSAHSPNIKERRDCSCGLYTASGDMAVQAEHIPVHLGVMPYALRHILDAFPPAAMGPGDIFIVNDPYHGGNHLPDFIVAGPLFLEGRLMGFAASMAHHNDVGGMAPRSMPAAAVEIFQEGLRIPPVRLGQGWKVDPAMLTLITANSRTPGERVADLNAQVAAVKLAQRRLEEFSDRFGADLIDAGLRDIISRSETAMRSVIAALPAGEWRGESFADFNGHLVAIRVRLATASDGTLTVDFTGTEGATASPFNSCYANTCACVFMALRVALASDIPPNGGLYGVLDIRIPDGTILNPSYPAAVSAATQVSYHTFEALMRAFQPLVPDRVVADSGGAGVFSCGGVDPRSGRMFTYGEAPGGGGGADAMRDGESAVLPPISNIHDSPVESIEMTMPMRVERYELIDGSGGAGRHRGGLGLRKSFRLLAPLRCSFQVSMAHQPPAGLAGGGAGSPTRIRVEHADGQATAIDRFAELDVGAGSLVVIESAGGGGYGPAEERDPAAERVDLIGGYVASPAGGAAA